MKPYVRINVRKHKLCPYHCSYFSVFYLGIYLHIFKKLHGIHGKLNLWSYVNQALLRINMGENRNFPATFGVSLLHRIVGILMVP
jgi:hypothetical protein